MDLCSAGFLMILYMHKYSRKMWGELTSQSISHLESIA
jgi:hypothetical protein